MNTLKDIMLTLKLCSQYQIITKNSFQLHFQKFLVL
jgi:hypothetical protein